MVSVFSYKPGNSFLYKVNALVKLFFLILLSTLIFFLPLSVCICFSICSIVFVFVLGFKFNELCPLWKIIFFYLVILFFSFMISLVPNFFKRNLSENLDFNILLKAFFVSDVKLIIRLIFTLHISAIFYRTTSSLEIRNSLEDVTHYFAWGKFFIITISLLFSFIPVIFDTWEKLKNSWNARGGKNNLKMIAILFPILISLCVKRSLTTANALENREVRG